MKQVQSAKCGVRNAESGNSEFRIPRSEFGRGFTLVELLVVIAIICILAALLLPVLSRAKDRARRVACLSNVRNLNTLFIMYARDNNDRLPRFVSWAGPSSIWPPLADYLKLSTMKPDAFFDPGMRPWRYYDDTVRQSFYQKRYADERLNETVGAAVAFIGYLPAFYVEPGRESSCPDFNWTIVPQPVQVGLVLLPAPNASERALTAGILYGYSVNGTNRFYNGFGRWQTNSAITWEDAPVNHRSGSNPWDPAGENIGMLDGSAKWRKFKEMRQRKYVFTFPDGNTGVYNLWW